ASPAHRRATRSRARGAATRVRMAERDDTARRGESTRHNASDGARPGGLSSFARRRAHFNHSAIKATRSRGLPAERLIRYQTLVWGPISRAVAVLVAVQQR